MNLENKVIVVTGGSGLLGKAIIDNIQKQGAVCINADISVTTNISHLEVQTDITDEESVSATIKMVLEKFGKIDGWVNNAYPRTKDWGAKLEDLPYASWQKNIDLQLNSYFLCCRLIANEMAKQKNGSVINIASIYGVVGPDFSVYDGTNITNPVAYSAIKGGIINMTKYFAAYFGKNNVRFNCVSPGGVFDNQDSIFVQNYEKKVPLKRMANPDDISPSVSFLLSDDASYITGHNLLIDGGWTII